MANNWQNPADAAQGYMNQIPGTLHQGYDPYVNAGQQALGTLQGQYNTLLNNPNAIMSLAGSGYQQSPGYQFQMNQGMNAINSAASSGGMLGTPGHQQQAGTMANDLANQDYQQYLNQTLGLYNRGLQGTEGINQMGYNASDTLAQSLSANLMNQGNMAYAGVQNQNQANADKKGGMMGTIGTIGGGLVGAYFGGPMGASMGASMGGQLGGMF